MKSYIPASDTAEKILSKQVSEMIYKSDIKDFDAYTGFLDERFQEIALFQINKYKFTEFEFYGGCFKAERKILLIKGNSLAQNNEFPISILKFESSSPLELTHRDYLGSCLSLGIKRECIGDILTKQNIAFVFVSTKIEQLLLTEIKTVGRVNVKVSQCDTLPTDFICKEENSAVINVASLRVDVVIAGALNLSRTDVLNLMKSKKVSVNHISVNSASNQINCEDVISIKGTGRLEIKNIRGTSRKGRIFIEIIKFL